METIAKPQNDCKLIPLNGEHFAIVDADFTDHIAVRGKVGRWYGYRDPNGDIRVRRHFRLSDGTRSTESLARVVANADKSLDVDHINHNTLDNRRSNLRACTEKENTRNRLVSSKRSAMPSKFKGVFWDWQRNKWIARIIVDGKQKMLGRFFDEASAAIAYNRAAVQYYGDFACLNPID